MAKERKNNDNKIVSNETITDDIQKIETPTSKNKVTGATESVVSILCYLGAFVAGAVILKLSKQNRYIRFNAAQSTIFTLSILVLTVVLHLIPIIGSLLSIIIALGGAGLWVIMIIKSIKHEDFRIPIISYFADKLVDKIDQKVKEKVLEE